ncbi:MAG TPA: anthranilate synthase component I family protein [Candidatus Deferrimicrobium sp.]|nr:anthranilate synthase component I family protein [Candidatus Deferrimicrobium sp.]
MQPLSARTVSNHSFNPALELFRPIAATEGSVWLDSSLRVGDKGQFSFIARDPSLDFRVENGLVTCRDRLKTTVLGPAAYALAYLDELRRQKAMFVVGYCTYEAAATFLGFEKKSGLSNVPDMRFLFYESVICMDHDTGSISVTNPSADDYADLLDVRLAGSSRGQELCDGTVDSLSSAVIEETGGYTRWDSGSGTDERHHRLSLTSAITKAEYIQKVEQILWHIGRGDIYQANFTARFDVVSAMDPFAAYGRLRRLNPSPYAAYMNFGDYQILSSSPERMFTFEADRILTCPIKGTIQRGRDSSQDAFLKERLLESEKDRAEHVMIVDVERNDLGRVARTGSVRVESLCRAEVYSSVIHLVSDISARIKPGTGLKDIFEALLPGGSITGAPKRRAAEIIAELESTPRSIYTGCIGYLHGDRADFNIAIRTIIRHDGRYYAHAGGGIVADSDPESEYEEMMLKAANLFRALGVRPEDITS